MLEEEYETEKDTHLQNDTVTSQSEPANAAALETPAKSSASSSLNTNSLSAVNPLASLTRKGSLILSRRSVLTSSFRSRNSSGDSVTSASRLASQDSQAASRTSTPVNNVENGAATKTSKLNGELTTWLKLMESPNSFVAHCLLLYYHCCAVKVFMYSQ